MEGIYEINTGKYTGILQNKNQIYAYGIIEREKEKKEVTESDHEFVTVDLVNFLEQQDFTIDEHLLIPFSESTTNSYTEQITINLTTNSLVVYPENTIKLNFLDNSSIVNSESTDVLTSTNTISNDLDEKSFISAFICSILNQSVFSSQNQAGFEHTIVCKISGDSNINNAIEVTADSTNTSLVFVDTQLNIVFSETTNIPNIWFFVDDEELRISRYTSLKNSTNLYIFYPKYSPSAKLLFCTEQKSNEAQVNRVYKYQMTSCSNSLIIVFGGINDNFPLGFDSYPLIFSTGGRYNANE